MPHAASHSNAPSCVVVVPLYKAALDENETTAMDQSLAHLSDYEVRYLTHPQLSLDWYEARWGKRPTMLMDAANFQSPRTYSAMLLSHEFYDRLSGADFHLICQTDAIVFKPELGFWLSAGYDYLGAPWPDGWEMMFPLGKTLDEPEPFLVRSFVGNGGFSLRRTQTMVRALERFPAACGLWKKLGNPEDLFFSAALSLMPHLKLPNLGTAAAFSRELNPQGIIKKVLGDEQSFGAHQWHRRG